MSSITPDELSERRASESRLNFLVSSSPVTIYTCAATPPFGATYISPNIRLIMGFEPEQFTEYSGFWAENIHPEDSQKVFDDLPQLFEHGTHQHEYRFRMHDGMRLVCDAPGNKQGQTEI